MSANDRGGPDVLKEIAALQERVAALHAQVARARGRPARRRARPRTLVPALITALLLALVPLSLLAANPFTDLVPDSVHNDDIDLIYNAGVTTGCVPNQEYCPTANVTRQEMASFLARLGGLGGHPAVVNALTAQTVPDGSITTAKLSNEGATAGQVLTATDTGVAFQTLTGAPGTTTVTIVTATGSFTQVTATCHTGHAIAGGGQSLSGMSGSYPSDNAGTAVANGATNPTSWTVTFSGAGSKTVWAVCAP